MISGIGIPLTLENESITLGLTIKAQYFLPENADQLKPIYFPGIFGNFTPVNFAETQSQEFPYGRRRREIKTDKYTGQKYEEYVVDVQEVGNASPSRQNVDGEYHDEILNDVIMEDPKIPTRESFVSNNLDLLLPNG